MGLEEQIEEREVLDSIFPDEITDISETSYRIAITLDIPPLSSEKPAEPPIILLTVTYPPTYPDTAPRLELSSPPNTRPHALFDLRTCSGPLLSALRPLIDENLGVAMIFTLVSALKDDAEARMLAARAAAQAARDREAALIEEEENRKFYGERVTRDRFLAWREGFRLEMEELRRRKRREEGGEGPEAEGRKKGKEERLTTGRALWEGGMVGRDGEEEEEEEEEEEGEGVVPGGGEKVQDLSRLKLGE